jgi:hypothetical protein
MSQPPMPPGPPTEPLPQPQVQTWPLLGTPPSRAAAPDGVRPQQGPVPVQQPPKKPRRFGWPIVIVTAVVALSLGGMLFAFGGEPTPTAVPDATATVTETKTLPAAESSEPKPKKHDQPKVAADTISDGTHNVGVDVKAGKYKTNVPEGEFCYWERIRGDDISDSTSTYKEGPARLSVTLKKGESFETEDCGTWKRV